MTSKTTDVAVPENAAVVIPHVDPVVAAWDEATQDASVLVSYDVAKDEYLDALCGIDMVITGVTYREGMKDPGTKEPRAYVSLEIMLSPQWDIRRVNLARVQSGLPKLNSIDELPWEPGDHVVVNSGSTGIYRQITDVLYQMEAIKLPEPVIGIGARGVSSFDLPPDKWADVVDGEMRFTENGFGIYVNKTLRVRCKKGIRVRTYTTDDFGDASTYYLA